MNDQTNYLRMLLNTINKHKENIHEVMGLCNMDSSDEILNDIDRSIVIPHLNSLIEIRRVINLKLLDEHI